MNIAFSAIVALAIVLPGLITVRLRRRKSDYPIPPPPPWSIEAAAVILAATVLHTGACALVEFLAYCGIISVHINLDSVLMLMVGKYGENDSAFAATISSVTQFPGYVVSYFLGLCVFASCIAIEYGSAFDEYFRKRMFDSDPEDRIWEKFFTPDESYSTVVSVVVELGGTAYLYLGLLESVHFDQSGRQLDRLALSDVYRRNLLDDRPPVGAQDDRVEDPQAKSNMDRFYRIHGDMFILRYAEVKTLNVQYLTSETGKATDNEEAIIAPRSSEADD